MALAGSSEGRVSDLGAVPARDAGPIAWLVKEAGRVGTAGIVGIVGIVGTVGAVGAVVVVGAAPVLSLGAGGRVGGRSVWRIVWRIASAQRT